MTRPPTMRFRPPGAVLVAAMIAFVSALPVAGLAWYLAPVLLVPLMVGIWAWRAGTDADDAGLRVRALFGTLDVPWSRVAELAADRRGRAAALLTDGRVIRLTAVGARDLPAVLRASGREPAPEASETDPAGTGTESGR